MKRVLSLALVAAILVLSLVSCVPSTPTPPAFTLDGTPLPAYTPLIYSGPMDGEASTYTPEEMIKLHNPDIPVTVMEKGTLRLMAGNGNGGTITVKFHGIYLTNGKKTAYTETDLDILPFGNYILAAEATLEAKNPKQSHAKYIFAGIDIRSDAETPTYLQKPSDTDLEFWLTEDVSQVDFSAHAQKTGWFGAAEYFGKGYVEEDDEKTSYFLTAYPDLADGGKFVTTIAVTDPKVKIIGGLTVASSLEEWDDILTRIGLSKVETRDNLDKFTLEKEEWRSHDNKFHFTVAKRTDGSCELYMDATVTNRTGIVY